MRGASKTTLHDLLEHPHGELEIEGVDICVPDQVAALHARLTRRKFQPLFAGAGVKNDDRVTISDVSTYEFVRVMVTNTLAG